VENPPAMPSEQLQKPMAKKVEGRKKQIKRSDYKNSKFGKLTAIGVSSDKPNKSRYWNFSCECGIVISCKFDSVFLGKRKSCGCSDGVKGFKHGLIHTREYRSWAHMISRCENNRNHNWANYGGRGITVCPSWRNDFLAFFSDMGPRPMGKTLDRINVNGNYCKENCRWATHSEQSNNTRRSVLVSINGKTQTLAQWGRTLNVSKKQFYRKQKLGMSPTESVLFYFKPSNSASETSTQ